MSGRDFPESFLFGCATSAFQVEGHIDNDWERWAQAGRLKDPQARCGKATDHWNRYEEDFDLLAQMGANAYRMSIEWARVEPEPGVFDDEALDRYARMISALRARDIEPFVTLLHFTHPTWFHELSPWHSPAAPERFAAFTQQVLEAIGDQVGHYTVLNEPNVWLAAAYVEGVAPGGTRGLSTTVKAAEGLVRAHAAAHRQIKAIAGPNAQVGISQNHVRFAPSDRNSRAERAAAKTLADVFNHALVEAMVSGRLQMGGFPGASKHISEAERTLDFIGVNYYSRLFVETKVLPKPELALFYEDRQGMGISDLGWEIYPQGLTEALQEMNGYGLPLYITENGIDDRDDSRRARYIHDHLEAAINAMRRGVDLRGYFHWSLLDNFEWLEAYEPRFGLVHVDYESQVRTPKASAEYFAEVIRNGRLGTKPSRTIKPGTGRTPPN